MLRLLLTLLVGLSIAYLPSGDAVAAVPGEAVKADSAPAKDGKAPAKAGRRRARRSRVVGWIVKEEDVRVEAPEPPSGKLWLYSVNFKEEVEVNIYNPDGSYSEEAAQEIAHIFRCRRTGNEHAIEPRLLALLAHVSDRFDGRRIELLSGYRYQRRQSSHHYRGAAADFRVAGVKTKELRAFVHTLDIGGMGVGYYPRVGFIHLDVRPPPSYRWTDYSRSNPDSRDKQPPRGWKRRKLES